MTKFLSGGLCALTLAAPAYAQLQPDSPTPSPATWSYGFNASGTAVATYPGIVSIPGGNFAPTVGNNLVLLNTSTTAASLVMRNAFAIPGDAPPLFYRASNSPCSLNSGNGDNGSQVKSADGKCWIAAFPPGPLDVTEWGVIADGVTDSTTALQAAWTYGGTVNTDILLPPSNFTSFVKFSQLIAPVGTFNAGVAAAQGPLSGIAGRGPAQTILKSTVTGSQCALAFNAPSTTYSGSAAGRVLRDFQLIQINSPSAVGTGICLNQITGMELSRFTVQSFNVGMSTFDTIRINMDTPAFIGNAFGIIGNTSGSSRPNQWVIKNPQVFDQVDSSFEFFNAADITILGGDFESNNQGNLVGQATIQMNGNPLDGNKGLTVIGGYYQNNGGDADFEFIQLASDATACASGAALGCNGENSITGVENARSGAVFTLHPVFISNTQPTVKTRVDVSGSAFWGANGYVPNAGRKYLFISMPGNNNAQITGFAGNSFSSAIEAPWQCAIGTNCENQADGHIEQWGTGVTSGGIPGVLNVTWPLSCPTAVDSVIVSETNGAIFASVSSGATTLSGVTISSSTASVGVSWRVLCH